MALDGDSVYLWGSDRVVTVTDRRRESIPENVRVPPDTEAPPAKSSKDLLVEAVRKDADQMREQGPALATMSQLGALLSVLSCLNEHEREVVMRGALRTGNRLLTGRRRYAPLDLSTDQRNWAKEVAEECSDGAAYADMEAIQRENGWPIKDQ
jgi:hypothetical protein